MQSKSNLILIFIIKSYDVIYKAVNFNKTKNFYIKLLIFKQKTCINNFRKLNK